MVNNIEGIVAFDKYSFSLPPNISGNMSAQQYGNFFSIKPAGASILLEDNSIHNSFQSCENTNSKNMVIKKTEIIEKKKKQKKSIMLTFYQYMNSIGKSDFKQKKILSIPNIEAKCGQPFQNMTCRREVAEAHIYKSLMQDFKGKEINVSLCLHIFHRYIFIC
jgi:hypothetical protein